MKKLICMAAALLLGAFMTVSAFAEGFGTVTVLGDSIATGFGLAGYSFGNNYSAAGSFGSLISKDCSGYENLAKDGATSAALLSGLNDSSILDTVSKADSIVISIGGNDFLVPMLEALEQAVPNDVDYFIGLLDGSVSVEDFIAQVTDSVIAAAEDVDVSKSGENVAEIIGKIRAVNPDCEIYILTVYDPFEGVEGMEIIEAVAKERLPQLNAGIASAAADGGAEVIDVYSAFAGHAFDYTNIGIMDIHPSAAGHEVIYSMLSAAMREDSQNPDPGPDTDPDPDPEPDPNPKPNPDTGTPDIAFTAGAALAAGIVLVVSRRHNLINR